MSSTDLSIADLKAQVQQDIQASEELQCRIDEFRTMISEGRTITDATAIAGLETEGRKMLKDLIIRIEKLEDQSSLTSNDREMLQALNARQVVCDKQVMQLLELRDLHWEARGRNYYMEEAGEFLAPGKRQQPHEKVPVGKGSPEVATTPVIQHMRDGGPSMKSDAESVESKHTTGQRTPPHPTVHDEGVHEVIDEDEEYAGGAGHEEDEEEPDRSEWPLCYRILDVDPNTDPQSFEEVCKRAYRRLSMKHEPQRLPNDPEAPARWAAIMKAYETLTDPGRKQYYDMHGREPVELEEFDLSKLSISERY